jgi:hypothetical protein
MKRLSDIETYITGDRRKEPDGGRIRIPVRG